MRQYRELVELVLDTGQERLDRTGTGTLSVFGHQSRYDLKEGFPLVTSKYVPFRLVATELEWFTRGLTNAKWLQRRNVHIWDEWARENGGLGPIYGKQWRSWPVGGGHTVDQLRWVVESLKHAPYSRRHIVSSWNVGELDKMALPPCHVLFQFYVSDDDELSCQVYQRSADVFLGVPFNIASYALLTHLIARETGLGVGELIHVLGDAHLYVNHIKQAEDMLDNHVYPLPVLEIAADVDLFTWGADDVCVHDYQHGPKITAPIAV